MSRIVIAGGPGAVKTTLLLALEARGYTIVGDQYCSKVFFLLPWKAIYVNDAERDHTFERAESVNSITEEWYRRCRYQLIEVPKVSVAERCT